ncbi:hypothetical protein PR048_001198 [Dryococelus australis]|uniref:Uncharacterized protein n=1 Tax=Dryococelus australis TaxID=614101 RepID=A0ABQ9IGQ0_9NEOP|nr:hypothetical protein PR048_001198 [Dryococelus australis]
MADVNRSSSLDLTGNEVEKLTDVKAAILLNLVGEDAVEVFNTFQISDKYHTDYGKVLEACVAYCKPRKNVPYERFLMYSRKQKENEPFQLFVNDLRKLVRSCEFGEQSDAIVRDSIFMGVRDTALQQEMLRINNLTLEKAYELGEQKKEGINYTTLPLSVNVVYSKNSEMNSHRIQNNQDFSVKCRQLPTQKLNHFAIMYRNSGGVNKVRMLKKQDPDSSDQDYYVVNGITVAPQNLKHVEKINFKLDTGSKVNILAEKLFKKVDKQLMVRGTKEILECYGGFTVKPIGIVNLRCQAKGVVKYMDFRIADADSTLILGLQACVELNFIKRVHLIGSDDTTMKIINQDTSQLESPDCMFVQDNYDVFTGLGKFPGQYKICVHKNVPPRAQPPRRQLQTIAIK